MATPTTEQIQQVQTNLANLISLNQSLLLGGNMRIENAFTLLSMNDSGDPGIDVGVNLLDSGFLMAGDLIPGGTIAATFACAVVANYTTQTPVSLLGTASSLLDRFQLTNYQFNSDLEMFHSNPEQYWDVVYSGSVNNAFGSYPVTSSLSELANITIPGPNDEGYQNMVNVLVYGTDQVSWFTLLGEYTITNYTEPQGEYASAVDEQESEGMTQQDIITGYYIQPEGNLEQYYFTCEYVGGKKPMYNVYSSVIGKSSSDLMSSEAANYLFSTLNGDYPNPEATENTYCAGLFNREFVFTEMGGINRVSQKNP